MKKTRVISAIFLAIFLCLSVSASAVHAQGNHGVFHVSLWDSDYITVGPGEAFTVEVFFCYVAPTPPRLVETVIAFDHKPIGCLVEDIGQAEHLGGHDYLRTFTVGAPSEPGIYGLTYGQSEGCTCEQAKLLWNLAIPLGTVEVIDAKEEEGYSKFHGLCLNGQGDYITVGPRETIEVKAYFGYVAPTSSRPEDQLEIIVGLEDLSGPCLIAGLKSAHLLGGHDYVMTFTITAATEPGIYHLYRVNTKGYTCDGTMELYRNPDTRHIIGTIEVIADDEESEEWTLLHQSNRTLTSPFGDCLYTIAFLQRQNDLRVQIQTPGVQEVETGKVYISVDEDVFVKYNTGCVYQSLIGAEDSDFVELKPGASNSSKTPKAFFDLIMGFVPYSGMFASTINLGTAIYEDTSKEFEVNENLDLKRILDAQPYEYFTTNMFQNERDVVTIPWALDIFNGREAIRVDCPRMEFPSKGTHTVVFCVIVNVHNVNVRHTIGLPIEIGKQKIEI